MSGLPLICCLFAPMHTGGLYLPGALWSILRVRELGASDAWIGIIAVTVNVSTIVGYFLPFYLPFFLANNFSYYRLLLENVVDIF